MLGKRSRTRRADPEPAPVPVARATMVDPVPLSLETQATAWLKQLDPEREAHAAANGARPRAVAHRIAGRPRTSTRSPQPRR